MSDCFGRVEFYLVIKYQVDYIELNSVKNIMPPPHNSIEMCPLLEEYNRKPKVICFFFSF